MEISLVSEVSKHHRQSGDDDSQDGASKRSKQARVDLDGDEVSQLAQAFSSQSKPLIKHVGSLCKYVSFKSTYHEAEFNHLVAKQSLSVHMRKSAIVLSLAEAMRISHDPETCYEKGEISAKLHLQIEEALRGYFKQATFGTVVNEDGTKVFTNSGPSVAVCAKQMVYTLPQGTVASYTGKMQAKELSSEVQCLVWARPLLQLAYNYVDNVGHPPPFHLPQLRFVEAYLASEQNAGHSVYLIEERIPGQYRKYINNDVAQPLSQLKDEASVELAEFLAFTQHVQHWKTRQMAFVTDYQG